MGHSRSLEILPFDIAKVPSGVLLAFHNYVPFLTISKI